MKTGPSMDTGQTLRLFGSTQQPVPGWDLGFQGWLLSSHSLAAHRSPHLQLWGLDVVWSRPAPCALASRAAPLIIEGVGHGVLWGMLQTCGNLALVLGELGSAAVILVPGTLVVQGQEAECVRFHVYLYKNICMSQYVCVYSYLYVCNIFILNWNRFCVWVERRNGSFWRCSNAPNWTRLFLGSLLWVEEHKAHWAGWVPEVPSKWHPPGILWIESESKSKYEGKCICVETEKYFSPLIFLKVEDEWGRLGKQCGWPAQGN